jgi:hypothetical protein
MPGSPTSPGRPCTRDSVPVRVAFHDAKRVGTQNFVHFEAQWLAYVIPCRRFAATLASDAARLGAGVDR